MACLLSLPIHPERLLLHFKCHFMKAILYVLSLLFCFATSLAQSPIQRIEPPNWWVGMIHNELDVLINGPEIASWLPEIAYDGVLLKEIKITTNRNYLFLKIQISESAQPGNVPIRFSKADGTVFTQNFPLLKRVAGRKDIQGFNASDAMYLITPDRFANGDPSNDDIPGMREKSNRSNKGGRHGGDIEGIRKNLDYIKGLGFTAIWMNPVLENDMPSFSYHGYAATDFYKVDTRFGSNEFYRQFCDEARSKGIKVIMDMIANHCGLQHYWLNDPPAPDWINQWPSFTQTNHRKTVILDPYASEKDREQFFSGWFSRSMPDINQRNLDVARYLIQNTIWWIEYAGIAGIRMDTYPYPDMHFMSDWSRAVMREYPNFNIVGEEWFLMPTVVSYWQKGKQNANGYTSELKSVMDFPLQDALRLALTRNNNWSSTWVEVYQALGQDYLYPDPMNLVIFPDNHDMSRIFSQLNEDFSKWKLALAFIATIRGIPQVYYGTEILMKNPGTDDHGIIRSDFPGGWAGDTINGFTGKGLSVQQREAQQFVKTLFNWRKSSAIIHQGKTMHFSPANDDAYVYFRYTPLGKVMVVLNKNKNEITLNLDKYSEMLQGINSGTDIFDHREYRLDKNLKVAAGTPMILELR